MVGLFMLAWMIYVGHVLNCIHKLLKSDNVHPVKEVKMDIEYIRSKKDDKKDTVNADVID